MGYLQVVRFLKVGIRGTRCNSSPTRSVPGCVETVYGLSVTTIRCLSSCGVGINQGRRIYGVQCMCRRSFVKHNLNVMIRVHFTHFLQVVRFRNNLCLGILIPLLISFENSEEYKLFYVQDFGFFSTCSTRNETFSNVPLFSLYPNPIVPLTQNSPT